MEVIGNTHGPGIHGTPMQRRKGLVTGAYYFISPNEQDSKNMWNAFCSGLEEIIDVKKDCPEISSYCISLDFSNICKSNSPYKHSCYSNY